MANTTQSTISVFQIIKLTLAIWIILQLIRPFIPPPMPESSVNKIPIQALDQECERYIQNYVLLEDIIVVDNFYLFGIGCYQITDHEGQYNFWVTSRRVFSPGTHLNLVCYVQSLYCQGASGCIVVLKEVKAKEQRTSFKK